MFGLFDGLRSSIRVAPGQFERCVLLLKLCREARTRADKTHSGHGDDLDRFVNLACGYIRGVAEFHASTSSRGRDKHDFEKQWKDTMHDLKLIVSLISANIERQFEEAMELDRRALDRLKETKGRIEEKKRIKELAGNGKPIEIQLFFADEVDQDLLDGTYEVEPRISAESLAALVMFSKRTDRVDLLNFYPKEGKKIGYDPANWEGGIVPRALLAVMDRGRFELNVPGLPHLCSNIFLMSKRSSVYLRESVGTLHRIPSTKNTELQIIRKDLQSAPVSSHSTWTDIYQQVREGRHPQAHWVVAAPSNTADYPAGSSPVIDNTSSGHENPINPETGVSPTNTSQKTHKVQLGVSPPTNPEAENRPDPPLLSIQSQTNTSQQTTTSPAPPTSITPNISPPTIDPPRSQTIPNTYGTALIMPNRIPNSGLSSSLQSQNAAATGTFSSGAPVKGALSAIPVVKPAKIGWFKKVRNALGI